MGYYFYILRSKIDNSYYVGSTNNLTRRLKEHNRGKSKYTRNKKPWELVYNEELSTLSLVRRRENQVKSWKKRVAIEKLIGPVV